MKGAKDIVDVLNEVLAGELVAINQYFLHSKMCANWGFVTLASHGRAESIDDMKHADVLIERILFLEGHPNVQRLDPVRIGENVPEQLAADLAVEVHALEALRRGIVVCSEKADTVTRLLLEDILRSEEEHIDYLETQLTLVEALGLQEYLQLQVEPGTH